MALGVKLIHPGYACPEMNPDENYSCAVPSLYALGKIYVVYLDKRGLNSSVSMSNFIICSE